MSAKVADVAEAKPLGMGIYRCTDIADPIANRSLLNPKEKTFLGDLHQPFAIL
ncbi:hypothetical protein D3C81_2237220 [compost metagenome]